MHHGLQGGYKGDGASTPAWRGGRIRGEFVSCVAVGRPEMSGGGYAWWAHVGGDGGSVLAAV